MAPQLEKATIAVHERIAPGVYRLELDAPAITQSAQPGQFVHLKINELTAPLLRRPLSIAGVDKHSGRLILIYRVVGNGTALLAKASIGSELDCLGPLGQGFTLQGERPLLIGGGIGLAPLIYLAGELCPRPLEVVMGGRHSGELFWQSLFVASCNQVHITTDDGSAGTKGLTVDILPGLLATGQYDMLYTCGPEAMMARVARLAKEYRIPCQVSLEEYMACGIGGCLACTCASTDGKRRKVCTDGPVFWAQEVFP